MEKGHWKTMFPTLLEGKKRGHLKVLLLEEENKIKKEVQEKKGRRNNFVVGVGKDVNG